MPAQVVETIKTTIKPTICTENITKLKVACRACCAAKSELRSKCSDMKTAVFPKSCSPNDKLTSNRLIPATIIMALAGAMTSPGETADERRGREYVLGDA